MSKIFVLDTNIILHQSTSIFQFEEHEVVVGLPVISELDTFKKNQDELGRNARHFSNIVDDLRAKGNLTSGVKLNEKGGIFKVALFSNKSKETMSTETDFSVIDNQIIAIALETKQNNPTKEVILVSNDTNVRIASDVLGLTAEKYENGKVDIDDLYTGRMELYSTFPLQFGNDPVLFSEFEKVVEFKRKPYANEFVILSNGKEESYFRYRPETDLEPEQLMPVKQDIEAWGLKPRNTEQMMLMDLLLDDSVKLVSTVGHAGTGKTLTSIACALSKVTDDFVYRKLLVARPVMPMGKDIGFLPGDVDEKLAPYMQPIYDNLEYLMSGYHSEGSGKFKTKGKKVSKKEEKVNEEKEAGSMGSGHLELVAAGILQVEPLTFIRGRSIPKQIIIIDESQNLDNLSLKTIITRAGEGTKIILTGDPTQVDAPYLSADSNGLVYCVNKFKEENIAGHITLTKCERSELAEVASRIL